MNENQLLVRNISAALSMGRNDLAKQGIERLQQIQDLELEAIARPRQETRSPKNSPNPKESGALNNHDTSTQRTQAASREPGSN
ncbi:MULTISPECIES: hypothetical protein [unclassified Coleofasciculus]|uniref:hypothetical protein n=1 Tax=unclassified Coleofasciculus TaxID=2692782 RepID=UPI00187E7784|nr:MULTISPECIES: hypothetical protein [unclassified Coleofasciculus]MBE9124743.1 hypothetical protein [Coleofasciculus sp. LEGE 07081]MBE9148195.1 hypothetical protein [Coleofasciculus sp. LEGE 07092]